MAAPTSVTIKSLTGTFVMDKTLSDSSIPVLKMQKIPWIVQQAVYYSTITVKLKQFTDDAGVVHIDQEQLSTGTVQHEPRLVTGEFAERDVQFWGKVKGKTSYVSRVHLSFSSAHGRILTSYIGENVVPCRRCAISRTSR
jgi:hypothetical protein